MDDRETRDVQLTTGWSRMNKNQRSGGIGSIFGSRELGVREGAWHDAQAKNAVMLRLVTPNVDAWYEQIRSKDGVVILKDLGDGGGIRSFLLEDPGGYTVEFFQWLDAE